jgi:hypothetical protein
MSVEFRNGVKRLTRSGIFRTVISVLLLCLLCSFPLVGQKANPTESQVKAAYLYNFGKFVRWPGDQAGKADSLEICVLGKDPFGPILDSTVEGDKIDGRKITVRRLSKFQELASCSILFVGASEEARLGPILSAAQRQGLLTVSDIPHFAEHGGVIGFVIQENKIRFEVNRGAAERSNLVLSSELLKVASRVIEKLAPQS